MRPGFTPRARQAGAVAARTARSARDAPERAPRGGLLCVELGEQSTRLLGPAGPDVGRSHRPVPGWAGRRRLLHLRDRLIVEAPEAIDVAAIEVGGRAAGEQGDRAVVRLAERAVDLVLRGRVGECGTEPLDGEGQVVGDGPDRGRGRPVTRFRPSPG